MKKGFYTALGTPFDKEGNFLAESMTCQIEQQIDAGASGLLVMGSMGIEAYIKNSEYAKVAECSAKAAKGKIPVLVGVTDVSIGRVKERLDAISHISGIDGVVSTAPYYAATTQEDLFNFYTGIAELAKQPVYLYDLPVVTKTPILPNTVRRLWKNSNIKGIKSASMVTQRVLMRAEDKPADFAQMFSNTDEFDIAYKYGLDYNLDGMFACMPKTAQKMYTALDAGDMATGGKLLDDLIALRDLFVDTGCLMYAFTHAMNLLGCEGSFAVDYQVDISDANKERVAVAMKALGEI